MPDSDNRAGDRILTANPYDFPGIQKAGIGKVRTYGRAEPEIVHEQIRPFLRHLLRLAPSDSIEYHWARQTAARLDPLCWTGLVSPGCLDFGTSKVPVLYVHEPGREIAVVALDFGKKGIVAQSVAYVRGKLYAAWCDPQNPDEDLISNRWPSEAFTREEFATVDYIRGALPNHFQNDFQQRQSDTTTLLAHHEERSVFCFHPNCEPWTDSLNGAKELIKGAKRFNSIPFNPELPDVPILNNFISIDQQIFCRLYDGESHFLREGRNNLLESEFRQPPKQLFGVGHRVATELPANCRYPDNNQVTNIFDLIQGRVLAEVGLEMLDILLNKLPGFNNALKQYTPGIGDSYQLGQCLASKQHPLPLRVIGEVGDLVRVEHANHYLEIPK